MAVSTRKDSVQLTKTSITKENIPINLKITFKEPTHKSRSLTGLVLELVEKPNQVTFLKSRTLLPWKIKQCEIFKEAIFKLKIIYRITQLLKQVRVKLEVIARILR